MLLLLAVIFVSFSPAPAMFEPVKRMRAFVGHPFHHQIWTPHGPEHCAIRNVKLVDISSDGRDEPPWLSADAANLTVWGLPATSGTFMYNILLFGSTIGYYVKLCCSYTIKIEVSKDESSLEKVFLVWQDSLVNDKALPQSGSSASLNHGIEFPESCMNNSHAYFFSITMGSQDHLSPLHLLDSSFRLASALDMKHSVHQVLLPEEYSKRVYKMKSVRVHAANAYEISSDIQHRYVFTWLIQCGNSYEHQRRLYRRSLQRDLEKRSKLTVVAWDISSGLLSRKRREIGIFFGSVSALVGTPEPSPSKVITLSTVVHFSVSRTSQIYSEAGTVVEPSSTLNPSPSILSVQSERGLSSTSYFVGISSPINVLTSVISSAAQSIYTSINLASFTALSGFTHRSVTTTSYSVSKDIPVYSTSLPVNSSAFVLQSTLIGAVSSHALSKSVLNNASSNVRASNVSATLSTAETVALTVSSLSISLSSSQTTVSVAAPESLISSFDESTRQRSTIHQFNSSSMLTNTQSFLASALSSFTFSLSLVSVFDNISTVQKSPSMSQSRSFLSTDYVSTSSIGQISSSFGDSSDFTTRLSFSASTQHTFSAYSVNESRSVSSIVHESWSSLSIIPSPSVSMVTSDRSSIANQTHFSVFRTMLTVPLSSTEMKVRSSVSDAAMASEISPLRSTPLLNLSMSLTFVPSFSESDILSSTLYSNISGVAVTQFSFSTSSQSIGIGSSYVRISSHNFSPSSYLSVVASMSSQNMSFIMTSYIRSTKIRFSSFDPSFATTFQSTLLQLSSVSTGLLTYSKLSSTLNYDKSSQPVSGTALPLQSISSVAAVNVSLVSQTFSSAINSSFSVSNSLPAWKSTPFVRSPSVSLSRTSRKSISPSSPSLTTDSSYGASVSFSSLTDLKRPGSLITSEPFYSVIWSSTIASSWNVSFSSRFTFQSTNMTVYSASYTNRLSTMNLGSQSYSIYDLSLLSTVGFYSSLKLDSSRSIFVHTSRIYQSSVSFGTGLTTFESLVPTSSAHYPSVSGSLKSSILVVSLHTSALMPNTSLTHRSSPVLPSVSSAYTRLTSSLLSGNLTNVVSSIARVTSKGDMFNGTSALPSAFHSSEKMQTTSFQLPPASRSASSSTLLPSQLSTSKIINSSESVSGYPSKVSSSLRTIFTVSSNWNPADSSSVESSQMPTVVSLNRTSSHATVLPRSSLQYGSSLNSNRTVSSKMLVSTLSQLIHSSSISFDLPSTISKISSALLPSSATRRDSSISLTSMATDFAKFSSAIVPSASVNMSTKLVRNTSGTVSVLQASSSFFILSSPGLLTLYSDSPSSMVSPMHSSVIDNMSSAVDSIASSLPLSLSETQSVTRGFFMSSDLPLTSAYASEYMISSGTSSVSSPLSSSIMPSPSFSDSLSSIAVSISSSVSSFGLPSDSNIVPSSTVDSVISSSLLVASSSYSLSTVMLSSTTASLIVSSPSLGASLESVYASSVSISVDLVDISLITPSAVSFIPASSSVIPATTEPDTEPVVVNSIGHLSVEVGQLFLFRIPEATFYDREDGLTRNLSITVTDLSGGQFLSRWLFFNQTAQMFFGLPLIGDFSSQEGTGMELVLTAYDSSRNFAVDIFAIEIRKTFPEMPFLLTVTMDLDYANFINNLRLQVQLIQRISEFYNDFTYQNILVKNFTHGSVVVNWSNSSVSSESCDRSLVQSVITPVVQSSGKVTSEFLVHLAPEFPVLTASSSYSGVCTLTSRPDPSGSPVTAESSNIFSFYVLPVIVLVLIILLLAAIGIFIWRRKKRQKFSFQGRTYEKGRPVLLPDEVMLKELPLVKSAYSNDWKPLSRLPPDLPRSYIGPYESSDFDEPDKPPHRTLAQMPHAYIGPYEHEEYPMQQESDSYDDDDDDNESITWSPSSYHRRRRSSPPPPYVMPPPYTAPFIPGESDV